MEQELIDFIRENGTQEILEQEPVPGMFRPLKIKYTWEGLVILEIFKYFNPPDSPAWNDHIVSYKEDESPLYKSIDL